MGRIRQHSAARRDLIEHFVYLAEDAVNGGQEVPIVGCEA